MSRVSVLHLAAVVEPAIETPVAQSNEEIEHEQPSAVYKHARLSVGDDIDKRVRAPIDDCAADQCERTPDQDESKRDYDDPHGDLATWTENEKADDGEYRYS